MLQGIRILEVEGLGPGPFAAMTLADLGAEVICVHRPDSGHTPGIPEHSLLDRGKRSITLDLKEPADVETFLALTATADGLIEGFRPGVMERLGLGPEACHAANPALVYGRMTGWGQNSPLAQTAGHDLNYISLSGALWYTSAPGDAPLTPATLVGDIGGGAMYLVAGMLAGIMRVKSTGEGCVVDAAIYDGSAHMMNLLMSIRQTGNFGVKRGANLLDGPHWSRTYACACGGYVSVQCLEPKFYALFLDKLGLAEDADLQQQFEKSLWPALTGRLAGIFASQPRDHWAELFGGSDACVAPVLNPEEALAHPMNARGTWAEVQGALQAAPAPRFSNQPEWVPPVIPERGQHTEELLEELGLK
ncbi:CaiB/BaiF CoA transferase family protein [Leisingera aquimarina]|uniref:CaiB/BaiF CoA transferase family protein n=1 Tax=Leisingera aquimarina TaxID=476529 RepID=UPI00041A3D31|nr:CaiB/BaiF CoA-transferase family protein [Leisingera aquimarina]